MSHFQPISKKEAKNSLIGILFIIIILVLGSLLFLTPYWYLYFVIVLSVLIFIAQFTTTKSKFECPSCKTIFNLTNMQDFFAFHGITKIEDQWVEWKMLSCPTCKKRAKMFPIKKRN